MKGRGRFYCHTDKPRNSLQKGCKDIIHTVRIILAYREKKIAFYNVGIDIYQSIIFIISIKK